MKCFICKEPTEKSYGVCDPCRIEILEAEAASQGKVVGQCSPEALRATDTLIFAAKRAMMEGRGEP